MQNPEPYQNPKLKLVHSDQTTTSDVSMDPSPKPKKKKKKRSLLQIYDHFLPNDLASLSQRNFFIFARPDGERCLLIAGKGKTRITNLSGNDLGNPF